MSKPQVATDATPDAKRSHTPLMILFLTVFIDLLGFGIVIPFLPLYAERMHVGAAGIGLLLSIYSLMQLLMAPVLGRISDYVGRRPIIMLGLLGSSVGYLLYGFAGSFAMLLVSRAVHGACAGTISTAQAYVADTTDQSSRARGMGMIGAAFGLGFVLGPAIGGLLGHSSLRTPVFFAAALTFANLIFAAMRLPESHEREANTRLALKDLAAPLLNLPAELTQYRLERLFGLSFVTTSAIAGFEATFAMMVPRVYGYGPFGVGGLFAFAGLTQAITQGYLLGKIVKRTGELPLIRTGLVLLALGLAPLASLTSHALLLFCLALLAIGYGLASPSIASLISRRTAREKQGEVLGANQSAQSLARIMGPLAAGSIYQWIGPQPVYFTAAVMASLALMLAVSVTSGAYVLEVGRDDHA
ncbi:MAG TPA: MFS transporter [Candidatus Binataceae bacterium]|nr:MFS transporter [Candidatus Binataceae bacterium]